MSHGLRVVLGIYIALCRMFVNILQRIRYRQILSGGAMRRPHIPLGIIIITVALAGTFCWDWINNSTGDDTLLALTSFLIGAITFFGIAGGVDLRRGRQSLTKGRMRTAIAASIVITYLFVLSLALFLQPPKPTSASDTSPAQINPITEAFMNSFTNVVGVPVAFYFGASAVAEALDKQSTGEDDANTIKAQHDNNQQQEHQTSE